MSCHSLLARCTLAAVALVQFNSTAFSKEAVATASPVAASAALKDYVDAPDSSYAWKKRRVVKCGQGTLAELILTSQTWQGTVWKHQLFIYRPSQVKSTKDMLLLVNGGRWEDSMAGPASDGTDDLPKEAFVIAQVSEALGTPIAIISQVPEQPLFDGKYEDAIISYTFAKFYETNDSEWPLLLPMVKSAVRAMDAVTEFTLQEWNDRVETFVVTGASKRGWTTWLTAAVDPRVSAIAPMVINMLNMEPHMKLQKASFGGYSDEISDYTERGLQNLLATKRGIALREIVDPYSYRAQITQPKLIVLGTNDRYWPVDSLNLYWDGLEGEKYVVYVPNNGHDIKDYPRLLGSIAALRNSVAGGKPLPKLEWKFDEADDGLKLTLSSNVKPQAVLAWSTTAPSRDFRESHWKSKPVAAGDGASYSIELPQPEEGYAAMFAELRFAGEPLPFYLSTGMRVVEPPAETTGGGE